MSKSFSKVLFGLGIRHVGETVAKNISHKTGSFNNLSLLSMNDILKIDDIGVKIAKSIFDFFKDKENIKLINSLKSHGVKFEIDSFDQKSEGLLSNKTIVVSGVFKKYNREYLINKIEKMGGNVSTSISKKTSYLIIGLKPGPSKIDKAKKFQIPIIPEKEFIQMQN